MSYIIFTYDVSLLEEKHLFHAAAVQTLWVPSELQNPAYWNYTVILTVVDMYATDDLGLILLLWRPNL